MAISSHFLHGRDLELTPSEVTGAVGDSVTVLPIVVSLAALTEISLPHVLLAFGSFQIVWGVLYRLPISVEPMKALAGLAIAGVLTYPELATAGLLTGAVLLALGVTNSLAWVEQVIPAAVVRGVQVGVALMLLQAGLGLAAGAPMLAAAAAAIAVGCLMAGYVRASGLVVLAMGLGLAGIRAGVPTPALPGLPPVPAVTVNGSVAEGVVSQLAMTVGNAAIATSLLLSDLFDADVRSDDLATSMGVMSLCAVPLGGLPMCHGSGGLAGKHAFGARTGGANVVLGVLYGVAALFAGGGFLAAFPMAVLGVLLVVVALQLGRAGLRTERPGFAALVGIVGVGTNVGIAVVSGVLAHRVWTRAVQN